MKYLLLASSLALFSLPSLAAAQTRVYLGVSTGTLSPTEDTSISDAGFAFGASVTAVTGGFFGFGASYLGSVNGETALGEATSFQSGSLDAKLMIPVLSTSGTGVTPYLRAGIGLYQFKADILGFTAETGVNMQVPLGGGVLIDLNDQLALGGDFAYHILFDGNFDETPERSDIDAWDATFNLVFKL